MSCPVSSSAAKYCRSIKASNIFVPVNALERIKQYFPWLCYILGFQFAYLHFYGCRLYQFPLDFKSVRRKVPVFFQLSFYSPVCYSFCDLCTVLYPSRPDYPNLLMNLNKVIFPHTGPKVPHSRPAPKWKYGIFGLDVRKNSIRSTGVKPALGSGVN